MINRLNARLDRIERMTQTAKPILVWCNTEAEVAGKVDAMIAAGEITEADRSRCVLVHWKFKP